MKLLLLSIGREALDSTKVRIAVEQMKDAARHIDKKVDIQHERVRFMQACASIEALGLESHETCLETTGPQTWELMSRLPKEGSIALNFFTPSDLKHLAEQKELAFLREIPEQNGLVVLPLPSPDPPFRAATEKQINETAKDITPLLESVADLKPNAKDKILYRFHDDMRRAIRMNQCFGLGGYRHETFVKGIREYIYVDDQPFKEEKVKVAKNVPDKDAIARREATLSFRLKKWLFPSFLPKDVPMKKVLVWETKKVLVPVEPLYLRVAFQDGSEGMPFPLFCLPKRQKPAGLVTIHAALISSRHFELDSEIDLCIVRNSELSRRDDDTFADQEKLVFQRAMKTFQNFLKRKSGTEIHLYHTGLEPAVVGMYRALIEILRWPENRGRLVVVPKLYHSNQYTELDSWF